MVQGGPNFTADQILRDRSINIFFTEVQGMVPKIGLVRMLQNVCIALVPLEPKSRVVSQIFSQLEDITANFVLVWALHSSRREDLSVCRLDLFDGHS